MKKTICCLGVILFVISNLNSQSSIKQSEPITSLEQAPIEVDLAPIGINATILTPSSVKAVAGEWSNCIVGDNNFEISLGNHFERMINTAF